jgi:hypothetical protein
MSGSVSSGKDGGGEAKKSLASILRLALELLD